MLLSPLTSESNNKFSFLTRKTRGFVNIMPLQTGSILGRKAKKALMEFGNGYAICDYCDGNLHGIQNPPVEYLVQGILPQFLGCDTVRLTMGAREGKFIVLHAMTNPGDTIIVDSNRHYSTYVAAESNGLNVIEVPNSGYPEYQIDVNDYITLIEKHHPKLVLLTYPDGNYGNLPDAKRLGDITRQYDVPYLLNGAYAVGRIPISLKETGADFIVASAHKSMASTGPLGLLGIKKKYEHTILKKSALYPKKEVEFLGCTSRGAGIVTLMASMPELIKRIQQWNRQVEKVQWLSSEMKKLGINQLGETPHRHDLIAFESPVLYKISKSRREKGYFLYKALKKRNIWGIKPGHTRRFKLSTFAASRDELKMMVDVFKDILNRYG